MNHVTPGNSLVTKACSKPTTVTTPTTITPATVAVRANGVAIGEGPRAAILDRRFHKDSATR